MNEPPKQFKTTVTVLLLLEMDEYVTVLGFKCNFQVLEDVKAVVLHKHANHRGNMQMLLKLNTESSLFCTGKMKKTVS